jgi:hypothetical protein
MSDWIEYKNEKGQTVYFNKTVSRVRLNKIFIDWYHQLGKARFETADLDSKINEWAVD